LHKIYLEIAYGYIFKEVCLFYVNTLIVGDGKIGEMGGFLMMKSL